MNSSAENSSGRLAKRILLTTFGSLGDLHPYLAIALVLKARGHQPVIATSGYYRSTIEALGISFHPVRPDAPDLLENPELMRKVMDLHRGPRFVIRDLIMPVLRDSYEDTLAAAEGADLLVSHPLTLTTPLIAEQRGLPWVSTMLSPLGFFSASDPPVLGPLPLLWKLRFLGRRFYGPLFQLARRQLHTWSEPWHRLRAELGLPPSNRNPLLEGQHAPLGVLALFSRFLAAPQLDWPLQTIATGFPFYESFSRELPGELNRFLNSGPPPLVFTLGSSAVMTAGSFYEESARAAQQLGCRAVLLVGTDPANRPRRLPPEIIAWDYVPFSLLFPRAAAIVHQGGIGTTAEAMRAGRPMLVMPYAFDQPDNAARVCRLGIARTIARGRYTAKRAASELQLLLSAGSYRRRAEEIGTSVRQEKGVETACDALEAVLRAAPVTAAAAS